MNKIENELIDGEILLQKAPQSKVAIVASILCAAIFGGLAYCFMAFKPIPVRPSANSFEAEINIYIAGVLALFAVFVLLHGILGMLCTSLYLTNKRITGKVGILSTRSVDAPLGKINTVAVKQGIFGHIFDYGTVIVSTSSGHLNFNYIYAPDIMKNNIFAQIDEADYQRLSEQVAFISETIK